MSLKGFVGGLSGLLEAGPVVAISALLGLVGGGYYGQEWAEEDWDGLKTEQTELVSEQFKENIQDLGLIKSQLKVMEGVRAQSERKEGSWSKDSDQWEKYTLSHIRMSEKLEDGTNKFVNQLLTNEEMPEKTISSIIDTFNTAHLDTYSLDLPKATSAYALREAQAEVGTGDAAKITASVSSMADEDGAGVLWGVPALFIGFFAPLLLAGALSEAETKLETRERKKANAPSN